MEAKALQQAALFLTFLPLPGFISPRGPFYHLSLPCMLALPPDSRDLMLLFTVAPKAHNGV